MDRPISDVVEVTLSDTLTSYAYTKSLLACHLMYKINMHEKENGSSILVWHTEKGIDLPQMSLWFYGWSDQVPIKLHSSKLVLVLSILSVPVFIYTPLFAAPEASATDEKVISNYNERK